MEAATARTAPAARPAPRTKPRRKTAPAKRRARPAKSGAGTRRSTPRSSQAPAGRLIRPAMAGAALFPQAAMRSVGAVRDMSDSSLIVRLTRGRGWIAVLCTLLGGIVALNVLSLSLTAGSGRTSLQIDALKTDVSSLQAQIDERLSAVKVEAEAARLGLANPDPQTIDFLKASDADARRVAHLLATDGFLLAPSEPSSYPAPGTSYAPVPTAAPSTTTTAETTTAEPTSTVTPSGGPSASSGGGASSGSGTSAGSGTSSGSSSGSSTGTTGGVGL
jgi:uncharacterized membrane protein YgcG